MSFGIGGVVRGESTAGVLLVAPRGLGGLPNACRLLPGQKGGQSANGKGLVGIDPLVGHARSSICICSCTCTCTCCFEYQRGCTGSGHIGGIQILDSFVSEQIKLPFPSPVPSASS
jgi:hypothetical protein